MDAPRKDLSYNDAQRLDLYRVEQPGRPLVICVHGGGFVSGARDDYRCRQAAELLLNAGFNSASVSYALADETDRFARWPRNLFDVADAVDFLAVNGERFGYDASRFALLGFSAGCCLSNLYIQGGGAMLRQLGHEVTWHRPRALVGFYGPYDFTVRQPERRSADPEINRLHSPRHWLLNNRGRPPPPVLHIQGDEDEIVYPDQHRQFSEDCASRDFPFEGVIARGFGHSFAPRDTNAGGEELDTGPEIVRFLARYLDGRTA
jgi:acetyl esterase/lipase